METIYRIINDAYSNDPCEMTLAEMREMFDQLHADNPHDWNVSLRVLPLGREIIDDNTGEIVARSLEYISELDGE